MSVKLKLNLPRSVWSAKDTKTVALNTVAIVKRRTMKGLSSNGGKFKEYSREPMYIAFKGARLKPKGGTRVSRTGASIYYAGGYHTDLSRGYTKCQSTYISVGRTDIHTGQM